VMGLNVAVRWTSPLRAVFWNPRLS
jgi:hypothetical protein